MRAPTQEPLVSNSHRPATGHPPGLTEHIRNVRRHLFSLLAAGGKETGKKLCFCPLGSGADQSKTQPAPSSQRLALPGARTRAPAACFLEANYLIITHQRMSQAAADL